MTWPTTKSKFASKKPCSRCGATTKAGDTIYKINEDYWCSNEHCPKQAEGSRQSPESSRDQEKPATSRPDPLTKTGATEYYQTTQIPMSLVDFHRDVWALSIMEAEKVYPKEEVTIPGSDPVKRRDLNLKDKMILAQVYYKALMGFRD